MNSFDSSTLPPASDMSPLAGQVRDLYRAWRFLRDAEAAASRLHRSLCRDTRTLRQTAAETAQRLLEMLDGARVSRGELRALAEQLSQAAFQASTSVLPLYDEENMDGPLGTGAPGV